MLWHQPHSTMVEKGCPRSAEPESGRESPQRSLPGGLGPPVGNLIIRSLSCRRTFTATEASRHFSALLDAVERGETVTIMRGSHPVAEIGPARRRTGADLKAALTGMTP